MRDRLIDMVIGLPGETCPVPSTPVKFGQRYWLAQHRWLEPAVGLTALVPVAAIYSLGFLILSSPAAITLMIIWAAFFVGGLVLRVTRPCTVLRLPVHALLVWLLGVLSASALGFTAQ